MPPASQQMQRASHAADPLEALPAAVVASIFARLDTRSLLQAGQVPAWVLCLGSGTCAPLC
jgi:hypothetical protein